MKKIALVEKCTGPKELFDYFIQLLGQFPYHSFLAKWQREQLDSLLENLPLDQAVCIHDYSEGYEFYKQIIHHWQEIVSTTLHSKTEILSQTIWNNKFIMIETKMVYPLIGTNGYKANFRPF